MRNKVMYYTASIKAIICLMVLRIAGIFDHEALRQYNICKYAWDRRFQ
jgi:hypothetical protein